MISVCWVYPDGTEHNASVEEGVNLMEAAVANDIESIYGECGGSMACATCHVEVDETSGVAAGQPFAMENEMLDMVESGRTPTSRLSCQLVASQELDGIRMKVTW
ncbi:2Fe-2S iron-sulfur cluster-binding protein [Porticoccaceae bacterium]|nr:2Fe-2S iron-sulfur cluster-binding protein [Porticoccaceae bacterium]